MVRPEMALDWPCGSLTVDANVRSQNWGEGVGMMKQVDEWDLLGDN